MAGSERVYNVALFGVTGCGKSSIINLLTDKPVADVSTMEGCTRRARWYPVSLDGMKFRLWDTMGFDHSEIDNPLSPYEQAHALLRDLQDGVDLILLCSRKDGINSSLRNLYWLLDSFFFGGQAQIALVLTHFDVSDDQWWDRNSNTIAQRCKIPVQSLLCACITTTQNQLPQSNTLWDQSKQALKVLLHAAALTPTPLCLDLSSDTAIATAVEGLRVHSQLSIPDATTLVEKFRSPKRPFNVILFGEPGVGKSSVIDLLVGDSVARVSSSINTDSCTLDYRSYEIDTGMHQYLVWETVGLNGRYVKHNMLGRAIQNAIDLIRDLHQQGGIDLLVFCKKSGRLSPLELNNLRLFHEVLCEGQVPIAFIITHLEHQNPMEEWWKVNGDGLLKACNLKASAVAGHACITSLPLDDSRNQRLQDKRSLSKHMVQTMLEDSIPYGTAFTKDKKFGVMSFLRKLVGMIEQSQRRERLTFRNLMDLLLEYGNASQGAPAQIRLMASLEHGNVPQTAPAQVRFTASINIILFGETGVGKSSVVNLIAGHKVASISPDADGRTLSSKQYSFSVAGRAFHIWDTAGLEQPEMGAVGYMAAIEGAFALIQELVQQGGLDLLLFCMRSNRVTATTQSNYRLFYEVLCRSQVPIVLVITHLEHEPDMDAWWTRNMPSLEKYGIRSVGHACVTGLPSHAKYAESKVNIERMLLGYNGQGKYVMPVDSWFIEFLRFFGMFAPPKKDLKKKDLLKVLTKRCKLNPKIAQELTERLIQT